MDNVTSFPAAPRVVILGPDEAGWFTVEVKGWKGHPDYEPQKFVTQDRCHAMDVAATTRNIYRLRLDSSAFERRGYEIDARLVPWPWEPEVDDGSSPAPFDGEAA